MADWTAYYGPNGFSKSCLDSKDAARDYIKSRTDLDDEAWFVLETVFFNKCDGFADIMAAAGYYPVKKHSKEIDYDRWEAYKERCDRIGCKAEGSE